MFVYARIMRRLKSVVGVPDGAFKSGDRRIILHIPVVDYIPPEQRWQFFVALVWLGDEQL